MVSLVWTSTLATGREVARSERHMLLWMCLLYKWLFSVSATSGVLTSCHTNMWTILSSPNCHKVGRLQLSQRSVVYSVDFELWPNTTIVNLANAVTFCQLLVQVSAGCDHGLLRLNYMVTRLNCVLHTFEAFKWLLLVWLLYCYCI